MSWAKLRHSPPEDKAFRAAPPRRVTTIMPGDRGKMSPRKRHPPGFLPQYNEPAPLPQPDVVAVLVGNCMGGPRHPLVSVPLFVIGYIDAGKPPCQAYWSLPDSLRARCTYHCRIPSEPGKYEWVMNEVRWWVKKCCTVRWLTHQWQCTLGKGGGGVVKPQLGWTSPCPCT